MYIATIRGFLITSLCSSHDMEQWYIYINHNERDNIACDYRVVYLFLTSRHNLYILSTNWIMTYNHENYDRSCRAPHIYRCESHESIEEICLVWMNLKWQKSILCTGLHVYTYKVQYVYIHVKPSRYYRKNPTRIGRPVVSHFTVMWTKGWVFTNTCQQQRKVNDSCWGQIPPARQVIGRLKGQRLRWVGVGVGVGVGVAVAVGVGGGWIT